MNTKGGLYGNILQTVSKNGNTDIVRLLLNKGADVNAQGGFYGNALQAASAEGHAEIICLLLDKGANVNAQGGQYGNALQAARWPEIQRLLLSRGANPLQQYILGQAQ